MRPVPAVVAGALAGSALVLLGLVASRRPATPLPVPVGLLDADAAAIGAEAARPASERLALVALAVRDEPSPDVERLVALARAASLLPLVRVGGGDLDAWSRSLAAMVERGEPLLVSLDERPAVEWTERARRLLAAVPVERRPALRVVERLRRGSLDVASRADLLEIEGPVPPRFDGPVIADVPPRSDVWQVAHAAADPRVVALLATAGVRGSARGTERLFLEKR